MAKAFSPRTRPQLRWKTVGAGFLLLVPLLLGAWLHYRPDPAATLQTHTQRLLDDVLGPGQTRLHLRLLPGHQIGCSLGVSPSRRREAVGVLTRVLQLDLEKGDRLAVVDLPEPEPSPWPVRVWLVGLGLTGLAWLGLCYQVLRRLWRLWGLALRRLRRSYELVRERASKRREESRDPEKVRLEAYESVQHQLRVEPLSLTLPCGLLSLVNPRKGALLTREMNLLRHKFASELGVLLPPLAVAAGEVGPRSSHRQVHCLLAVR